MHNQQWEEAADAAAAVIASGKFNLSSNYKNLFLAAGQDKNPEIMFSARYLNPDRYATEGADMKYGAAAALNATMLFMDEFECTDGLPIATSPLYNPASIFANRDPRLALTIRHASEPITNPANGLVHNNSLSGLYTPYLVRKYVDPTHLPYSYATRSDQDFILMRYAELLLIYAESRNEASGPDQSVYDAVNAVRARPGVNMPALSSGLDQVAMRDRIRHERRVELGGEGRRYLDIKRWRTAETIIPTIVDPGGVQRKFNPQKNYVFPFPQGEVDVNQNLDQNPNY
jgi:starch-binding outer membrane protein, SusD/RagB family